MKAFCFVLGSTSTHIAILQCRNPHAQIIKDVNAWISLTSAGVQRLNSSKGSGLFLRTLFIPTCLYPKPDLLIGTSAHQHKALEHTQEVGGTSIRESAPCPQISEPRHCPWPICTSLLTVFFPRTSSGNHIPAGCLGLQLQKNSPGKGFWQFTSCLAFLLLIPSVAKRPSTRTGVKQSMSSICSPYQCPSPTWNTHGRADRMEPWVGRLRETKSSR